MGQWVLLPVTLVAWMVGFCSLVLLALGLFRLPHAGWKEMPTVTQAASILPGSAPGGLAVQRAPVPRGERVRLGCSPAG